TRAYNELVSEGLAVGHQGRGVFVHARAGIELRERAEQRIRVMLAEAVRAARIADLPATELHRLLEDELTENPPQEKP
ncbi:MAG: GntR family transcriptional regulator, partial [Brachybacterium sp.]|nr:GntR family transcriptional regulator [Brachybacterium sp.]